MIGPLVCRGDLGLQVGRSELIRFSSAEVSYVACSVAHRLLSGSGSSPGSL
jgi:hypothetical protein